MLQMPCQFWLLNYQTAPGAGQQTTRRYVQQMQVSGTVYKPKSLLLILYWYKPTLKNAPGIDCKHPRDFSPILSLIFQCRATLQKPRRQSNWFGLFLHYTKNL